MCGGLGQTEALLYLRAAGWWLEGASRLGNELPQEEALLRGAATLLCSPLCSWDRVGAMASFAGGMGREHLGVLGDRVSGYFPPLLVAKPCGLRVSR